MFREHVVWLREDHIKQCGLRKPPIEKQDASSVQSGADWGWCCSEGGPAQTNPPVCFVETNRELKLTLRTRAGCVADFNKEQQNTTGYEDTMVQWFWRIVILVQFTVNCDAFAIDVITFGSAILYIWTKHLTGPVGSKRWMRIRDDEMDKIPFSHRENFPGHKDRNIVATCVSLFTFPCLLTQGISWFKPQHRRLNY